MRKYILILLIFISYFGLSQTSPTYENITIRNQATIRQKVYFIPTISAPAVPFEGMLYADTDHHLYYYNGTSWLTVSSVEDLNDLGDVTLVAPDGWDILRLDDNSNQWVSVPLNAAIDSAAKQTTPAKINEGQQKLVYWKMDWARAFMDNQSTDSINNANILLIGDSYVPLYGYPIKEVIGGKYGYGGGWDIFLQNTYAIYGQYCNIGTGWTATTATDADNWNDQICWSKTDASVIKVATKNWNSVRIQYKSKPGWGKFSVTLNSGTPDTVDCNTTEGAGWYKNKTYGSTIATMFADTVYIRKIGTDTVRLFGYALEMNPVTYSNDNKKGYLNVHLSQNGGSTLRSRYLNRDTAEIHQFLDTTAASLCIITALDNSTESPVMAADSLIGLLKILRPQMDIILVCPNDETSHFGQDQEDSLLIIARSRGVMYFNAFNLLGSYTDLAASLAIQDGTHLSGKGKYLTLHEFDKLLFNETPYNYEFTGWKITNRSDYIIFPRSQNIAIVSKDVGYMTPTLNNTLLGYRGNDFVRPTGNDNTYIGSGTGEANTTGSGNTALGVNSMTDITEGNYNTAVGVASQLKATTNVKNTAIGYESLKEIIAGGDQNTAIGYQSLCLTATADGNTGIGESAGRGRTGAYNTIVGYQAGYSTGNGTNNTSVGSQSMTGLTTGTYNTAMGNQAMYTNTSGHYNTAIGSGALYTANGAGSNVAVGMNAGYDYTSGLYSVFIGNSAGENTTGSNNTFVGYRAGFSNVSGTDNIFIGYLAGYSETGSNKLYISNTNTATPLIKGDFTAMSLNVFGVLYTGNALIADNDSTPSVAAGNTFVYSGSANSVSIDALDDHIVGAYYTIFGNSDTYTITIPDGSVAGGDSFNLSATWVGGIDDCITLYCKAADTFKEVSRSNN